MMQSPADTQPKDERAPGRGSVLVIDPEEPFGSALRSDFARLEYLALSATAIEEGLRLCGAPDVIVMERSDFTPWPMILASIRERCPACAVVVLTAFPSIAGAVEALRSSASAYVTKPATAEQILAALRSSTEERRDTRMTLDRAVWEYIARTVETAGTLSGGARRLGIDRRSLKRMLKKYPPRR